MSTTSTIYVMVVFMKLLSSFCSLSDPVNVLQKTLFSARLVDRKDAYSCIPERLIDMFTD